MDPSAEIMLLHNFIGKVQQNSLDDLVSDIMRGLHHEQSDEESDLWKIKISSILLRAGLNKQASCHIDGKARSIGSVEWNTIFHICFKHDMARRFLQYVFTSLPCDDVTLVLSNLQIYLESLEKCLHGTVIDLLLTTLNELYVLLHHNEEGDHVGKWCVKIEKLISTLGINHAKLSNTDFRMLQNTRRYYPPGYAHSVSLRDLNLQVMSDTLSDLVNTGDNIEGLSLKQQTQILDSLSVNASTPTNIHVPQEFTNLACKVQGYIKTVSFDFDCGTKCTATATNELILDLNQICSYWVDIVCTSSRKDQSNLHRNLMQYIHRVKYQLLGHDEAFKFLLHGLGSGDIPSEMVDTCLDCITQYPSCFSQPKHIHCIFRMLHSSLEQNFSKDEPKVTWLTSERFYTVYKYFLQSFKSMQVDVKLELFDAFIKVDPDFHSEFKLKLDEKQRGFVETKFRRELNVLFNTFTSTVGRQQDVAQLTGEICDLAIVSSKLLVHKLACEILSNADHHNAIAQVLCKFKYITGLMLCGDETLLLNHILNEHTFNDETEYENMLSFLKVLLPLLNESADTAGLVLIWCNDLLKTYLLPCVFGKNVNHAVSMEFAVKLSCLIFQFSSEDLKLLDCLCLLYGFAKMLSLSKMGLELRCKVSECLIDLVSTAAHLFTNPSSDTKQLLVWFDHITSSLHWSTQLYLRSITCNNEAHKIQLPRVLETIGDIPSDLSVDLVDSSAEGTALTMWLKCTLIDPGLLPISFLRLDSLSLEEQELFSTGLVVALAQILPNCNENEWTIIIEVLKSLLQEFLLHVPFPLSKFPFLPFINLDDCRVPLCLCFLLHRVNVVLASACCAKWMSGQNWSTYTKYYAIAVKSIVASSCESPRPIHQFILFNFFQYSCDFLAILKISGHLNRGEDFVFVLLLDLLNEFCQITAELNKEKRNMHDNDMYTTTIKLLIERISIPNIENSLMKKMLNALP